MTGEVKRYHTTDLVVVGGGPAGLSAAAAVASTGMKVTVIDESALLGGRLLGQLYQKPGSGEWWNGTDVAGQLIDVAERNSVQFWPETAVWAIEPGFRVFGTNRNCTHVWDCSRILLATGAAERPVPIPGWELPGVMSIGGAQVVVNVHRLKPGKRTLIVGINLLSVAIARELSLAGVDVVGIVLPAASPVSGPQARPLSVFDELLSLAHLAPSPFIRLVGPTVQSLGLQSLAVHLFPRRGVRLWGVPIQPTRAALRIVGDEQVRAVVVADVTPEGRPMPGSLRDVEVDLVCIAGGLYPLIELANSVGCATAFSTDLGGHVPIHSKHYETTVPNVFVTGNMIGIESAQVAIAQGKATGWAIAFAALGDPTLQQNAARAEAEVVSIRKRASIKFIPTIERGKRYMQQLWWKYLGEQGAGHG